MTEISSRDVRARALDLVNRSAIALVGSIDASGFPNIKAMLKMENEDIHTLWFSSNTSAKRTTRFLEDPRACVYFLEADSFTGLMLIGTMVPLRDPESRQRLWRDGFERFYPLGVDDPDYTALRFTAVRGNFYADLANVDFIIER